jgi:transcriptional regulator with XRE-family HTH domain
MKTDGEIKLLREERRKGASQKLAAARTGMSERTARKYEHAGKLPSQMKEPRAHRTRENPFSLDWPWVEEQLKRGPALQAKTLFALQALVGDRPAVRSTCPPSAALRHCSMADMTFSCPRLREPFAQRTR